MKIIPLSEGVFTIDKSKVFVPFEEGKDDLRKRPKGSLLVEVQPFVVVTSNDVLLLDTGLGFKRDGELQLYSNLKAAGLDPSSVTKVLLSHLHKDHAGGVSYSDNLGHYHVTFPNATYYVSKAELEFAYDTGYPSFMTDELSVLRTGSNIEFLDKDGTIDNYIEYKHTGGHSPHHIVFFIREGDEIIFFGGDEAPQHQQLKNKFTAKYDHDGKKAMQLRQEWWDQGQREGWTFLFYHDIKLPMYEATRP